MLPYDRGFEIQVAGALPGTFLVSTYDETGKSKKINKGFYSDGRELIILPCASLNPCFDKFKPTSTGDQKILIEYFPCRTGDAQRDKALAIIMNQITPCTGEALTRSDEDYNLERNQVSLRSEKVCELYRDGDGRAFIARVIPLTVARNDHAE